MVIVCYWILNLPDCVMNSCPAIVIDLFCSLVKLLFPHNKVCNVGLQNLETELNI